MRPGGGLAVAALLAVTQGGCAALRDHTPGSRTPAAAPPATAAAPANPTKVVRVIVAKPLKCVPDDIGPPPAYPDTDAALRDAGGAADRYQLIAAGRILRQQRLQKLEDAIRRCRAAR
jgi:hypothetical protein